MNTDLLIQVSYFVAAILFILGLKRMSSPVTARSGMLWAGIGMVVATLITFLWPDMGNFQLVLPAMLIGGVAAYVSGKKVSMANMPQMIALYNGMGGGAAAAISAVVLFEFGDHGTVSLTLAMLGGLIGAISFTGSLIAFAKLQGIIWKDFRFKGQNIVNAIIMIASVVLGTMVVISQVAEPGSQFASLIAQQIPLVAGFFIITLILGFTMTLPIGGGDMPVVISLYNALTGLAVAFEGFAMNNAAMIIAGTVVGAAGTLLTKLMAKAMNRSLGNVLFSGFGESSGEASEVSGSLKPIEAPDAGIMMAFAENVIIIPGYGMAVAQAQHKVWELTQVLIERGVKVKFAIQPVAGRMPGHMNVLLAEAGVPYDLIYDEDEINAEFDNADVALIIGANDVVNPVARTDPSSPIFGMPILNADKAKNAIVIKRGKGAGFSGIENALFLADNTRMLYGDGQKMAAELINAIKEL